MSGLTPRRIDQWATEPCPNLPYLAPELHDHLHVSGIIGGKEKITSRVVHVDGRVVTTKTGSVYELGEPSGRFLAFLAEHGLQLDPVEPVKLRRAAATDEALAVDR
jgi:hypothetical protein